MPSKLSRSAFVAGTSASAFFTVAPSARSADLEPVTVGIANSISDTVIFIAVEKGYFRDAGLAVTTTGYTSASDMVAPLGTGQLDVGGGSASAGLYNAVLRGIDLKIVADKASSQPGYAVNSILVQKAHVDDKRVRGLKDLKGMKVAITGAGTSALSTLNDALKSAGVAYKDVEIVYMSFPDQVVALQNKAIDAAVTTEPSATIVISRGYAVKIATDDKIYPGHDIAQLLYSQKFAQQRNAAAKRFLVAYLRGARFYNGALRDGRFAGPNADEVISIISTATPIKDTALLRAITASGCDPNGRVNVASLEHDLQFYREQGLINGNISLAKVVDNSFAEAALKQLGPYRR
ncbi:MAG TPA: ABC transporter substrate-binding protein [Candidatus Acidoferrales bacterium]|nr:ABC transporter substrate-binding protein [Candidatus Acidoferrales bacterium]